MTARPADDFLVELDELLAEHGIGPATGERIVPTKDKAKGIKL